MITVDALQITSSNRVFFSLLYQDRKYYWRFEAVELIVICKNDDKMVTGSFFLLLFCIHICGWHFDDEEKRSSSATITKIIHLGLFFCLFFSRRMTLFTRISTLQIDRLTIVLIRINIANPIRARMCVCLVQRKCIYVAVQWLLFDERKERDVLLLFRSSSHQ